MKSNDKENILKAIREKSHVKYRGTIIIQMAEEFSWKQWRPKENRSTSLKWPKKSYQPRTLYPCEDSLQKGRRKEVLVKRKHFFLSPAHSYSM